MYDTLLHSNIFHMDYSRLLNERQLEAVSTTSQYVRIIAGAGSGKTRVLTYRISYLVSELNVDPSSILAIAFTNKVANEMKNRVINLLPNVSSYLSVSTFHSFCARFLRQEVRVIDYPSSFVIFDEDDQERLIKDITTELGYSKKDPIVKQSINYIGSKKCSGKYPCDITIINEAFENEKTCLKIYMLYEERKEQMLAMDFDDLLLKTIEILTNFPMIREKWQNKISNILIDEFQDTNDIQYKLVKLLLTSETSIYVVGDPDQTIYTWRGANQDIILNFEKQFPGVETIILDRNYRSTKTILDAANKLIAKNIKRVPKDLYTNNINGDKIVLFKGFTKDAEADWIVRRINQLLDEHKAESINDIAVLYRSSYLTLPLEKALVKSHIPYRLFGGVRFFQRKEIKDVLAYFRLLVDPRDDVSFDRIVNVPKRGIGDTSLLTLKTEARANNLSLYEYVSNIEKYPTELRTKNVVALTMLTRKLDEIREKLKDNLEVYAKVLEDMLIEIGYYSYLKEEDDGDDRIENVKALFADMLDFIKKNPDDGFEIWLQNCTLATSQDDMSDGKYLSLMTVHVAKGLEYPFVFIEGLSEGVFPSQRTMDESGRDGLEEERRLAYVAFTRAKKQLFLSCNSGYSFTIEGNPVPSRFIAEAELSFPEENSANQYRNGTFAGAFNKPKRTTYSFFDDGPNSNPFEDNKPVEIEDTKPKTNGITDWAIGDVAEHDKFGRGVVKKIIDNDIIVIHFENQGDKTLLSTHPMLRRVNVKGDA